jgi:hypothetical protein
VSAPLAVRRRPGCHPGRDVESPYFNSLLHSVAQDERYNSEMSLAKEEFEAVVGPIYETDRTYDARINSFHNWYILDRPLGAKGLTPLNYFIDYNANTLPESELTHYRELRANVHSVFELGKFLPSKTRLRDLVTGKRYDVEGTEHTQFLDKGALFNTRVFRHGAAYYVSNYFLLHPPVVAKLIRAQVKKVRKAKDDPKALLFRLVLFQGRFDQYKQMEPRNIYRFEA